MYTYTISDIYKFAAEIQHLRLFISNNPFECQMVDYSNNF